MCCSQKLFVVQCGSCECRLNFHLFWIEFQLFWFWYFLALSLPCEFNSVCARVCVRAYMCTRAHACMLWLVPLCLCINFWATTCLLVWVGFVCLFILTDLCMRLYTYTCTCWPVNEPIYITAPLSAPENMQCYLLSLKISPNNPFKAKKKQNQNSWK